MVVEDEFVGHGPVQQVAGGGVHDALGFAGGAGGVEDEERIFRVHLFAGAVGGDVGGGQLFLEPGVAAFDPVDVFGAGVLDDDAGLDVRAIGQGGVGVGLDRDALAATQTGVAGDHEFGAGIEGAVTQGLGGEAAEHHAVDGADAGAGQHGDGQGGDHGQVDDNPVALLDALLLEHVGELGDLFPELLVGDGLGLVR